MELKLTMDTLQCLVKCKPKCLKCKLRKHCTNPFFILLLMNFYTYMKLTIRWAKIYSHMKLNIRLLSLIECNTKMFKYSQDTPLYVEDKVIAEW